jgi:hypothetical protein
MSRNKKSKTTTFSKQLKHTKSGYKLNRNGVPLDNRGINAMSSSNPCSYQYKPAQTTGTYRPTIFNLSKI